MRQSKQITKQCQNCKKSFTVTPCRDDALYCSKSCHSSFKMRGAKSNLWKGGMHDKTCPYCGKTFQVHPSLDRRVYCSRECHNLVRQKRITRNCKKCGEEFVVRQSSVHIFCSRLCWLSYNVGVNTRVWLGGKSFEPYPPTFNRQFKRMIRERDNHICAMCGKFGDNVHHINYVKNDTHPENCITLCRPCHSKTNFNREYWTKFFQSRPR